MFTIGMIYAEADQITLFNTENNSELYCTPYIYRKQSFGFSGPTDIIEQSTNHTLEMLNLGASGSIQATYQETYERINTTDLSPNSINLHLVYSISPLLSFYGSTYVNTSSLVNSSPLVPTYANNITNSSINISEAYMIIGNFKTSSYYAYAGQTGLPYATNYSSISSASDFISMIQSVTARAAVLGYKTSNSTVSFNPEWFLFYGDTTPLSGSRIPTTGINIITEITLSPSTSIDIASGFLSNIADSDGFQITNTSPASRAAGHLFNYQRISKAYIIQNAELDEYVYYDIFSGFAMADDYEKIQHRVAGASLALQINTIANISLSVAYATALRPFDYRDLSFTSTGAFGLGVDPTENFGAQPSSGNIYIEQSFNNGFSIYMGYEESWQALALAVPKNRMLLGVSKDIDPFTQITWEVRKESNYGEDCFAYGRYFTSPLTGNSKYSIVPVSYALGRKSTTISLELSTSF